MSITVRGEGDETTDRMVVAFQKYQHEHPDALVEIHRQNSVTIYIRIIDSDLSHANRAERHESLWHFVENLPEEDQSQISLLLALTPEEAKKSFANLEFDQQISTPSGFEESGAKLG